MIDIKTKIHDKFSIEFKVGFIAGDERDNNFAINTWIFLPNSLDINPSTYGKSDFYRDIKSNVRFITPTFLLQDIARGEAVPLNRLRCSLENLAASPAQENIADYEYHIKIFAAIVKSSLREAVSAIENTQSLKEVERKCLYFVQNVCTLTREYRKTENLLDVPTLSPELKHLYAFGDEYISQLVESYSFRIIHYLDTMNAEGNLNSVRRRIVELIQGEVKYKREKGYVVVSADDPQGNRRLVYRHNILKKYVGSVLYIKLDKREDGKTVRQIYYSIAAGIAMVFATVIAFAFQRKFGNFSGPLFVALVVSYMLKDRIKELTRYYFAHRLGRKYFDNRADINIKEQPIGQLKEGMDFITDDKVPAEVLEMRGRTPLLEAENRIFDEKIILYRTLVYINGEKLAKYDEYKLSGINNIFRLHINRFTLKMDDPQIPLRRVHDDGRVEVIYTDRIYYINFIMQFRYGECIEYKRFRLVVTRNGILDIEELNR